MIKKTLSLLLILAMALSLASCGKKTEATDLMQGIAVRAVETGEPDPGAPDRAARFAVDLFRGCHVSGKNTLVSSLSVMAALAMAANGAKGETLAQMEEVLGMTAEQMNAFFHSLMASLPQSELNSLHLANSMWITDDEAFSADQGFLQKNRDYLGADAFKVRFDAAALEAINGWVEENTHGLIPRILEDIDPGAVMYLVNALAFEGEWETPYREDQVNEGIFTNHAGEEKTAEFMYGTEYSYLNDGKAEGFIKYYKDRGYAFAALLPAEGVSLDEYVASLDGPALRALLAGAEETRVETALPKFEAEFGTELSGVLRGMGMPLAFDPGTADFSGIGSAGGAGFYIGRVIHKTHIQVDEKGTRAGAATAIEIRANGMFDPEVRRVYLDRPFVYMLIETGSFTPFFIGCVSDIGK